MSQIMHFDSLNGAVYNTSNQYNSYNFNTNYLSTSPNAFNATFNLATPLKNIKKVSLKSIEIPIGWNNIRVNSRLNIIGVASNYDSVTKLFSNIYSVSIPDKTYSNINVLITDINIAFASLYPSVNIIFSIVNSYVNVTSTSTSIFTNFLYMIPTNLTYMLGFRANFDVYSVRKTDAPAVYLLNIDNYINMTITNLSASGINNNANGVSSHFKIITNTVNNVIYYVAENNSFSQNININPNYPITNISVILTDRFGYSLNSAGLDYSFTLEFEK